MDPKAALDIINDSEESHSRRIEAVHDLAEWLGKGGAVDFDAGNISGDAVADLSEDCGDLLGSIVVAIA